MKAHIFTLGILTLCWTNSWSQEKQISGQSQPKKFSMEATYEKTIPPNLNAYLDFEDDNNNGILEAMEKASLKIRITNDGRGPAQGLMVKITDKTYDRAFKMDLLRDIGYLAPGKSKSVEFKIEAGFDIKSQEHKIQIDVIEHFGYDMDPAYLVLQTLAYQQPKLEYIGHEIIEDGKNLFSIVSDGKLQLGEQVKLKVLFQNTGKNTARNLEYKLFSSSEEIHFEESSGTLQKLEIGEIATFTCIVSPNKRVETTGVLPIYIDVGLDYEYGRVNSFNVPVYVDQKAPEPKELKVEADFESLARKAARFETSSNRFKTNVGNVIDIRSFAKNDYERKNSVAIVIGVEEYANTFPAKYAKNDAEVVSDYLKGKLGIEQVETFTNDEINGFFFTNHFDPIAGELQKTIIKGETDLFVFYSGHGVPDKTTENVYLFPHDGRISMLEKQGYNMTEFYKNLESLGARSTTVFLDACFSGSNKPSKSTTSESLTGMRAVTIKAKPYEPWMNNENFSVFSSSSMNQTSLAFDESETGLFTYYICAGLKGEADKKENGGNGDGSITNGELYNYIHNGVKETSVKISGLQTPQFNGNKDFVLIE
ncbi:MAG: caspase family protein [Bacteroidia bacterium]